ncbi:hypothetical protein ACEWY4_016679 [Coilia grayii]|uniref:Cyclic nucleotide-binding domain-containing protein 2 n=1 Tax=Coilia grayii TaxID=363190 RepID=A0ABD1JL35_9TELE
MDQQDPVEMRSSETLCKQVECINNTVTLQNWRLTREEIKELQRLQKLESSLKRSGWPAVATNVTMEDREIMTREYEIAVLEARRDMERQENIERHEKWMKKMKRLDDVERHQLRMRDMERCEEMEIHELRMAELERIRRTERKRQKEVEWTKKMDALKERRKEEQMMKDMEEEMHNRQRMLEKELEGRMRSMEEKEKHLERERQDRQHQLEMQLKEIELKCAMERETAKRQHEERLRELEMKCKLEWETKTKELEHKLQNERSTAQKREEELMALINQEQEHVMETLRHASMEKEGRRRLDAQMEWQEMDREAREAEKEMDRERSMKEEIKKVERKVENERQRQMQREYERWREMQEQMKRMEQKIEMDREMEKNRNEERWRELHEKREKEWKKRTRELSRELQEAQQREQELLKLTEKQEMASDDDEKWTTLERKERKKYTEEERLRKVNKQKTKSLRNEGEDWLETVEQEVMEKESESLVDFQQFVDENEGQMKIKKNKREGRIQREKERQNVERPGQLDGCLGDVLRKCKEKIMMDNNTSEEAEMQTTELKDLMRRREEGLRNKGMKAKTQGRGGIEKQEELNAANLENDAGAEGEEKKDKSMRSKMKRVFHHPQGRGHGDILERFRKAVRSVMAMCRVCRIFMSHSKFSCCMQLNMLENLHPQPGTGKTLVFDLNHFKVKKNHIPLKLVEIMWRHPEHRSEQEVLLLQSLMMAMDSFRRYSPTLQLLLSRIVRYQRLERRRVVVKKGDPGHSFYFVFSGQVAVTTDTDGSSAFVDKEPILIKKGMGFGDVALIKGVKRNATIVCVEETELMVIDKEDFFANKMDVELKREFEYRFNFFRSLELVSSWPSSLIERLADHSKAEQFRYGHITVKDTNDMGNLIFIARGLCDVFRQVDLTKCKTYQRLLKQQHTAGGRMKHALQQQQSCAASQRTSAQRAPPTRVKAPPGEIVTSAWFLIDTLQQGSTFGLNEYLIPLRQRDGRSLTLVSRSVEILRVEKTCFDQLVDDETLKKLQEIQKTYPSDEDLCGVLLRHRRWEEFKQGVIMDVLTHCRRRDISAFPAYWDITTNPKSPGKTTTSGRST